jgi:hypothetical protein
MIQLDLPSGIAARDKGIESVSVNNASFVLHMRAVAESYARRDGQVDIDILRVYASDKGIAPFHCNAWGAIFNRRKFICLGFRRSHVTTNHARTIRVLY